MDSVHYISWLFGILFTCTAMLPTLIVPWHNALREPFYSYEIYVYYTPAWLALLMANFIMRLEYWAGIKYDKKMNLFFFLIGIGAVIYAFVILLFYFCIYRIIWKTTRPLLQHDLEYNARKFQ